MQYRGYYSVMVRQISQQQTALCFEIADCWNEKLRTLQLDITNLNL